jgi:hypothetical protein
MPCARSISETDALAVCDQQRFVGDQKSRGCRSPGNLRFPIVYSRNLSNVRPFSSTSNMTAAQASVGSAPACPTSGTIFSLQVFSWRVVIDEVINF